MSELIPVVTLDNLKEIFCDYYKWLDKDLPNGIYTRQQILAMIEIHLSQIMKLLRNEKGNL